MPSVLSTLRTLPALLKYTITSIFDSSGNPHLCGDGLYLIPVFSYQTTDIKSLNSIRSFSTLELGCGLSLVITFLPYPRVFPLVQLGRSFDPRAVVMN